MITKVKDDYNNFWLTKRVSSLASGLLNQKVICYIGEKTSSRLSVNQNVPSYIYINPNDFKGLNDDGIRTIILHEIAHHKFSPANFNDPLLPRPLIEVLEEARIETKLVRYILDEFNNKNLAYAVNQLRKNIIEDYFNQVAEVLRSGADLPSKKDLFCTLVCAIQNIPYRPALADLGNQVPSGNSSKVSSDLSNVRKALELVTVTLFGKYADSSITANVLNESSLEKLTPKLHPIIDEIKKLLDWPTDEQKSNSLESKNSLDGKKLRVCVINNGNVSGRDDYVTSGNTHYNIDEQDTLIAEVFARKLGTVLTDRQLTRFQNRQRNGKLDTRTAHKLVTANSIDLFKKRKAKSNQPKYQFQILLDKSSSMEGSRIFNAVKATYILAHALDTLKVKNNIIAFNNRAKRVIKKELSEVYSTGGTDFYEVLGEANGTPLERSVQEVILMVTDGEDQIPYTLIDGMKKERGTKFIVIGIENQYYINDLKTAFGEAILIKDTKELPDLFLSLVRKIML